MTSRIWRPHSGSQYLFVSSPVYETLYSGTRGPGKTLALLMDFAQHVGQGFGPYWRGILFRQTYPQLADVVAKTKLFFSEAFPGARFNGGDYKWIFPDGEELLLRHMRKPDDYWNYHGHEYPWIGWEELTNWPSADCYESMFACSRSPMPGMPRKYRATTNPYGRGHNWVKKRFIDPAPFGTIIRDGKAPARVVLHGTLSENAHLSEADPEYVTKLQAITDPNKRAAWLYGSWDITSGGMFDDLWDRNIHIVQPFEIPHSWRIDRAFDWGSSAPFSVGWYAESDGTTATLHDGSTKTFPRGTIFRIAEWYGWTGRENEGVRMLAKEIARGILEREERMGIDHVVRPGPADTSIFDIENGNSISDDMESEGVVWERADKSAGSRKQGLEQIRTRLVNAISGEGPGFYVFGNCSQFIRTVPTISRDEKDPDDVDTDAEDHVLDEVRYRIYTRKNEVSRAGMAGV